VLEDGHVQMESSALLSKNVEGRNGNIKCRQCGKRGHSRDKC